MNEGPSVHIGGNVTGQLLFGDNGVQIQAQGDIVNPVFVTDPIRPRARPVRHRPSRQDELFGRDRTVGELVGIAGIENAQVVAATGWGKSSVLKHITYHEIADGFFDGVVHVAGLGLPADDISAEIYAALFDTQLEQMGFKPTAAQVRSSLNGIRALLIVDDVDLDRHEVDRLIDLAPESTVITAASAQTLWTNGLVIDLAGLDPDAGVRLLVQRLRQPLADSAAASARRFCESIAGYPAGIVAAAAALRRGQLGFPDLDALSRGVDPLGATFAAIAAGLTAEEQRALAVLDAVDGAALPAAAVANLADLAGAQRILEGLHADGLVQTASPRFRLPQSIAEHLDLPDWNVDTLDGLISWLLTASDPDPVAAAGEAIVNMVQWGLDNQRSEKAMKLARVASGGLTLAGRWGQWQRLMELASSAADVTGSQFEQAWVMHQQGTRALCVGDRASAEQSLQAAESIRSTIGDRAGLEATRHNLNVLAGPVPPPPPPKPQPSPPPPPPAPPTGGGLPWWLWVVIISVVAFGGWRVYEYFTDDDVEPTDEPGALVTGVDQLDFGEVLDGESPRTELQLINGGGSPLDVESVRLDNGTSFAIEDACGRLDPFESCSVMVRLIDSEPGKASDILIAEHTGGNGTVEVRVSASIVTAPAAFLQVEPSLVDFGVVGQDPPEVINRLVGSGQPGIRSFEVFVSNPGNARIDLVEPFLDTGDVFLLESDCRSLEPGQGCRVLIHFVANEPGTYDDALVLNHDAPNEVSSIPIIAAVVGGADLEVEVIDFGATDRATEIPGFTYWAIPVEVAFRNIGGASTLDDFAVWFEWRNPDTGSFQWIPAGNTPDLSEEPFMTDTVPALGEARTVFFVAFDVERFDNGQPVTLRVLADSCHGTEFIADPPCRVEEADESNNMSPPFEIVIEAG